MRKRVLRLLVIGDLVGDGGEIALQLGDPLKHLVPVFLKQRPSHRDGAVALAAKFGVALHVADRHAGGAQALQEGQPREILGVVTTLAAVHARDRVKQPDALVVAQRVRREPRQRRNLRDRERSRGLRDGHGNDRTG